MESLVLFVAGGIAFVVLLWALLTYNGFIRKPNHAKNALSSIDVNLKKRHDLIPNLVSPVDALDE